MKYFLHSAKFLALDLASTLIFVAIYATTHKLYAGVAVGVVIGLGQIGYRLWKKLPIDTMQWMSLFLVLASATAAMITRDARFILIKPSIIYVIIGIVMLKPGWMNRYMPPIAMEKVGDVATIFGFVWAGLMFVSAGLNLYVAMTYDVVTWTAVMSTYAMGSKIALFVIQFATMRGVGVGIPAGAPSLAMTDLAMALRPELGQTKAARMTA